MILIVDDQQQNILPLKKILSLHGLDCDEAHSGEDALRKTLQYDYSLIILDVQMPGMDGFEVAETLAGSSRTKDIPVIFLSAISKEKKYITKGYETGGVDYITKPADPDLLILKVKSFLKMHRQQKELKELGQLLTSEIEIRKDAQENLELKVAERTHELLQKNEELELNNHELQQFAWVVSHDLKEPIRKIEIFLKLIRERCLNDNENGGSYASRAIMAAERMNNLINDLLAYSRLSSPVLPEICDLNEIVGEVMADLDYVIESKKARIIVHNDLDPVIGVPSQLRQVFQNLISNSLKFAKNGTTPQIDIYSETVAGPDPEANERLFQKVVFKDNGIGFDQQYNEKIFTIFQRLHHKEDYEGTGIGLAIAKKIIEKHEGRITGESKPGQGATFTLFLPSTTAKKP